VNLSAVTILIAFGAGILSFASPCCLPLVPAYLGYMTGVSAGDGAEASPSRRLGALALAFVLGLAVIFTLLGASANALGQLLLAYRPLILRLAGLLIVIFGLHLLGVLRLPWLYREKRAEVARFGNGGYGGAFLMGAAFGLGWTPCIGPVLAGILAVASQADSVYSGMALLFVYALGLGLPFVAFGLLLARWRPLLAMLRRRAQMLSMSSGAVMACLGLLLFSGRLTMLTAWATSTFGIGLAR